MLAIILQIYIFFNIGKQKRFENYVLMCVIPETIMIQRIYPLAHAYILIGLREYTHRLTNIGSLPEAFRRLWDFGVDALPAN